MRKSYTSLIFAAVLSGCASQLEIGPTSVPVVPVKVVIDALKCGLSKAVAADYGNRAGLPGATASVSLDVNVIEGRTASGGISAGIPVFQGVGTITPSFSITNSETRTLNSSIDFDILISRGDVSVCKGHEYAIEQDAGFSAWIGQVVAGINQAVRGKPYAQMKEYTYESDFAVKMDTSAGLEIAIVPVKLNTSVGSSRSDIQHMKVDIKPVHVVMKNGKPVVVPGSRPTFVEPKTQSERRGSFNLR
jgi:hypothetical protein